MFQAKEFKTYGSKRDQPIIPLHNEKQGGLPNFLVINNVIFRYTNLLN